MTARPLYAWCTKLDLDNSYEGNIYTYQIFHRYLYKQTSTEIYTLLLLTVFGRLLYFS